MSDSIVRSALFVPGSRPERFAKALASGADAVIVDFEDAVEEPLKVHARESLERFLLGQPQVRVWVRINAPEHPRHCADLQFCQAQAGVVGILLPKVESAAQVARVAASGRPVWPIIESARGLLALAEIATAPGVHRLAFGGLDLALDLNLRSGSAAAQFALDQARLALILHSRAAGLQAPLDGVFPGIGDSQGLAASIRHAYAMGFAGALCIHPAQVPVLHQALAPSPEELAWAQRVVEGGRDGAGAYQIDGQMVDAPVLLRAQRLLALA